MVANDDDDAVPMSGHSQESRNAAVRAVVKGLDDLGAVVFFEKALTSSDASGSGRVVIPKAIAEQYFPRLEQQNGIPVRAVDTRDREYTFKYRFWVNNGVSRMYLLEGAGELHRAYEMNVGDVMVFAQKPDGTLVVAGRPATRNDVIKKPPVKRPSGRDGGGGGSGGRSRGGEAKPRNRAGEAARAAAGGGDSRAKKRKAAGAYAGVPIDAEPTVDGIFRAVPNGLVEAAAAGGVHSSKTGRWVVSLNLAGEMYQALFETQDDANEAYNAAGFAASA